MLKYLILVPKLDGAIPAAPPGPGWRLAHRGRRASIWVDAPATDGWSGAPCPGGYRLGVTAACDAATADAPWGAYIEVLDLPHETIVYRDPSGRLEGVWSDVGSAFVVASHLACLLPYLRSSVEIDWEPVLLTAAGYYLPGRRTGLRGVQELINGEAVAFRADAVAHRLRWRPRDFYRRPARTRQAAADAFRRASRASTDFWAARYRRVVLDLSGGLDSSIMLGLLATSAHRPEIICLNKMVAHAESDERAFAAAAAKMHDAPLVERLVESETEFRIPAALPPRPTLQLAELGFANAGIELGREIEAEAFFTGRGGDHIFHGHVPTLSARDYLHRTYNPLGWLAEAYRAARRNGRTIGEVIRESLAPGERRGRKGRLAPQPTEFITADALAAIDLDTHLHPWVLDALDDAPAGKFRQVVLLVELQRHYERFGRAEISEEAHPFISQPTFEAALATPSWFYARTDVDRDLERETFRDLIPDAVYRRREKGGTSSHSLRTYRRNLDFVRDLLLDGELASRGLVNRAQLEPRLTSSALLYGRFNHDLRWCLISELWIRSARAHLDAVARSLAS